MACCFGMSTAKANEQQSDSEQAARVPVPKVTTSPAQVTPAAKETRWIELVEKDGAIVPQLHGFTEAAVEALREKGVELLSSEASSGEVEPSYVVYIKQYSEAEHEELGASGFHRGYTLKSFFQRFKELLPLVKTASVQNFLPFMDGDTQAVFT